MAKRTFGITQAGEFAGAVGTGADNEAGVVVFEMDFEIWMIDQNLAEKRAISGDVSYAIVDGLCPDE